MFGREAQGLKDPAGLLGFGAFSLRVWGCSRQIHPTRRVQQLRHPQIYSMVRSSAVGMPKPVQKTALQLHIRKLMLLQSKAYGTGFQGFWLSSPRLKAYKALARILGS